jgi:NAD(P)H-nitrite reductase large subunit
MGTAAIDKSLIDYLLQQSIGVVAAGAMFWLYVKEKRATEKRLTDLLRERKNDRDELLRMYGRIDAFLTRADLFERVDRQALRDITDPENPKRRATDRELLDAIAAKP